MKATGFIFLLYIAIPAFSQQQPQFKKISPNQSAITFVNKLEVNDSKFFDYNDYGNSSGVGVGDFNNDGLTDIFFSGNKVPFKLYLNEGDFHFKDVTSQAGVAGNGNWGTGVSIVDINGDGLLDIYVSHSGNYSFADSNKLCNELFINQGKDAGGVPHFKEMAKAYGLDLPGSQTTQVVFFDYDNDGDLDAFVLNHAKNTYIVLYDAAYFQKNPNKNYANRLLRNDGGHFTDVSRQAGILGSNINFGLGVIVSDINNDGWPDLYCTSDFEERDYLYINQHDGTFKESLASSMGHISNFSMGVDIADINNDGLLDLMTVDMKPPSNYRQKVIATQDNDDKFRNLVKLGFYAQYPRNMLQLNQGIDINGVPHFSEIGQMAGVAATDWSWSPLFADFDNDGWKDLFISCGYANNDNLDVKNRYRTGEELPNQSLPLTSQFFKNQEGQGFVNVTNQWKKKEESLSYGAVYADFDNDGALDLVIANINDTPLVLKNTGGGGNYLSIKLNGTGLNRFAIGAKVFVQNGAQQQVQELQPVRGYESSQDYILHFGLGKQTTANIRVIWPDGTVSEIKDQACNRLVELQQVTAAAPAPAEKKPAALYRQINLPEASTFISKQNDHPDFKYQFTLPYKVSDAGQVVAMGDINGDGLMDYYIGGEAGTEKFFMMGTKEGLFTKFDPGCFEATDDNMSAVITDIDKDGNPDLIIVSRKGSNTQPQVYDKDTIYVSRVYQNTGNGKFLEVPGALSGISSPMRTIAAGDIDKDGDTDIFIGGYTTPMTFGRGGASFVFRNDSKPGKISFTNITANVLPSPYLGMVTSAEWKDMDQDGFPELLIAGEWMSCRLLKNKNGRLSDISTQAGLSKYNGLWSFISAIDVNGDGHLDIVAGNVGLNNPFNADSTHFMKLHLLNVGNDVTRSVPVVSCFYNDNKEYPVYYRDELLAAVQPLRKVFVDYDLYAKTTMPDLIKLSAATEDTLLTCNTLVSGVFLNDGHDHFNFLPFPAQGQESRINAVTQTEINGLVAGGNFFGYRTQFGMEDAMPLILLKNTNRQLEAMDPSVTGLFTTGQVSRLIFYTFNNKERILVFRKNESPQIFESNHP